MLDYISKQLKARMQTDAPDPIQEEAQMDEAILECAHLFQELDDLSIEGTEAGSPRPFTKIDIPLEDDIEITNVELNLLDGRVTDIPADATVQEFEYYGMKDHNYFYQEAYRETTQFMRESDEQYSRRLHAIADQKLAAYKNYCIQEGLFGFDKLNVNDGRVPSRVTLDFGKLNGKDYSVKLVVKFEVDKKHRILKKQLDSIMVLQMNKEFETAVQSTALMIFGPKVGIENQDDIWKKVTPIELVVPCDPADKFCVAIGFELEGSDKTEYLEWVAPIKAVKKGENDWQMGADQKPGKTEGDLENVTSGKISKLQTITKGEAIKQEAYEMEMNKHVPNRFYQEAIDFGNPDEAPASDPNAASVSFDTPPADGAEQPAGDVPADGSTDAPTEGETEDKEIVDTNNVSDQIAEKISDETQNDANAEDVSIDGVDSSTDADVSDVDTTDAPSDEEIAEDLGEDASTDAAPEDTAETSDIDFDNMTIDELMAQGQEKMKTMTMQQLKDFLQNGPEAASTDVAPDADVSVDDTTQEAFFLTRGNIGKELDIHLRKALGILNSSELEITELCKEFRKEGKKLNRVLHKASKMKDVFGEKERTILLKCNHCLTDLMSMLRSDIDPGSIMTVKRMIQAFVAEATGIAKLLEKKKEEPVQESTVDGVEFPDLPFDIPTGPGYVIKGGEKVPIDFFGKKCTVKISDVKMTTEQKKLIGNLMIKSKTLFNDAVRKGISDQIKWMSSMIDYDTKSIDKKHPENTLTPKYIAVDQYNIPNNKWAIMVDCDWDLDPEHGLAIIFDKDLKLVAVAPAGNYL